MMTTVSPLSPRYWNLPSLGGVGIFYFAFSSSSSYSINGGTGSVSWENREEEKEDDASYTPATDFHLARRRKRRLRSSPPLEHQRPQAGSPLGIPPPCMWCCLLRHQRWYRLCLWRQKWRRIKGRRPLLCRLLPFNLGHRQQQRLRLLPLLERQRPHTGSPLELPTHRPWCRLPLRALMQSLWRHCRHYFSKHNTCCLLTPLPPAGCRLGINHDPIIRHQNVLTTQQRRQSILNLCTTFYITTLKMVGDRESPWWYTVKVLRLGK